ncbi:MAG: chorismate mutase [Fidelibacterota bacterium]|nr:MAG: chorismate mutase [Candidatus Neomarinimicrobiota bacterium]
MEQNNTHPRSLEELRAEIDELDQRLFSLLARRMAVVRTIGEVKRSNDIPISDPVREALLKARLKELASGILEPWHVEELASVIIRISRELQTKSNKDSNPKV